MTLQPVARLRQHVYELAAAFDVDVHETAMPPDKAGANATRRVIVIGRIVDETTYAVALHEMGHVLSPTGAVEDPKQDLTLLNERSAWEWAKHYALDWSPAMQSVADWAFSTYTRNADTLRRLREAAAPPLPATKQIDWSQW